MDILTTFAKHRRGSFNGATAGGAVLSAPRPPPRAPRLPRRSCGRLKGRKGGGESWLGTCSLASQSSRPGRDH